MSLRLGKETDYKKGEMKAAANTVARLLEQLCVTAMWGVSAQTCVRAHKRAC